MSNIHTQMYTNEVHPRSYSGGVLLPEKYKTNEISKVDIKNPQAIKHGNLILSRVSFEDGSIYDVKSFEPEKRATDIAVTMTTPWLTEPNGYNYHMANSLMRRGFPIDLVSAERQRQLLPHIGKSAHNQLRIARHTAELYDRNDSRLLVAGVSRAAMIGLSLTAQAKDHNFDVYYGDYIVPCFPESFMSRRQFKKYINLPKVEISSLPHIAKLPLKTLIHYPETFSHTTKAWINHIAAIPPLLSGDAGVAAKQLSTEQHGTVIAFEGDLLSQGEAWQEIFNKKMYPYMDMILIKGGAHLSCAEPTTIEEFKERFERVKAELVEQGDAKEELVA